MPTASNTTFNGLPILYHDRLGSVHGLNNLTFSRRNLKPRLGLRGPKFKNSHLLKNF